MNTINQTKLADITIGRFQPLALIAGPCVIESRDHTLRLADAIARITRGLGIPFIFKASYDKANRTSVDSFRGPGLDDGLPILAEVRRELNIPILSDVHTPQQVAPAGNVLDCLQVPAFLCRQTDLLLAVGFTGKCVNIKKGQFMSPEEMGNVVAKVGSTGNRSVLLTDRGTFFGYNRLVNDMTCISQMQKFAPVVFDATHSCQLPGGAGHQSGGLRQYVEPLALAALAAGADALFVEVHDDPDQARSDPATVYPLDGLERLLTRCIRVYEAVHAEG
jgi:2-dehydro-3-deoxyphosphooctonate aldolase (KDO 8-P synthase)